jgi:hypothetical protein
MHAFDWVHVWRFAGMFTYPPVAAVGTGWAPRRKLASGIEKHGFELEQCGTLSWAAQRQS